jgi:hypothetical protein
MYGRIHYENETGEFRVLDCETHADYERELNIACKWIEAEPRRRLGIWGERFNPTPTEALDLIGGHVDGPYVMGSRAAVRSGTRTSPLDSETTSIQTKGGSR